MRGVKRLTRRAGSSFHVKSNTKTVAKRKSRRPRTTVLLTLINMFLNVIASRKCLGISIIPLENTLKLLIKIVRPQNDRAILEFYRSRIFHGADILMKKLKIFNFWKNEDQERNDKRKESEEKQGERLLYELSERKPG